MEIDFRVNRFLYLRYANRDSVKSFSKFDLQMPDHKFLFDVVNVYMAVKGSSGTMLP